MAHTRILIQEAIKHWQAVLESKILEEFNIEVSNGQYPDYSANTNKNLHRHLPNTQSSIIQKPTIKQGIDLDEKLTVGKLEEILKSANANAPVMYILRKTNGPNANSETLKYANVCKITSFKELSKAVVFFDKSFESNKHDMIRIHEIISSRVKNMLDMLKQVQDKSKVLGLAVFSNRIKAVKLLCKAYQADDGKFYIEVKENVVHESSNREPWHQAEEKADLLANKLVSDKDNVPYATFVALLLLGYVENTIGRMQTIDVDKKRAFQKLRSTIKSATNAIKNDLFDATDNSGEIWNSDLHNAYRE